MGSKPGKAVIDKRKRYTDEELKVLIEENKKIYYQHFDKEYLSSLIENVFSIIADTYFRPRFIGFTNLPVRNNPNHPLIYASNHSGMAFPWDAMVFGGGLLRMHHYNYSKGLRALAAPMLSQTTLMNPYMIPNTWKRVGGVDANTLNFETMMQYQESDLLIYPEGVPGIGKGFNRKYQLQKLSTSFIRMSIKYKTDIIPFATINAEYINPFVYSLPAINRVVQKIGIPFLPIGIITPFILIFPWMFYMAYPAKLTYIRGKRIKPYELINKPFDEITRDDLLVIRDKIHQDIQGELSKAERIWGRKPYHWKEFFKKALANIDKFPYTMPFGWPLLFNEFHRKYKKSNGKPVKLRLGFLSTFRILLKNPITIAYYIPILGWVPLLVRGYWDAKIDPSKCWKG